MGIELVQWGEVRKPTMKNADPGVVSLLLRGSAGNIHQGIMTDPDGYFVVFEPSDKAGADLSVSVIDPEKTAALYTAALGFKPDGGWLDVPGTSVRIRLTKAVVEDGLKFPFPEPGRGMLRLQVHNIAALSESLKSAGFSVITTGGAPVTLPQGPQVIILRDPNNFYLQPMEAR